MAFVEPITIAQVINEIHRKNYLLPAIQREFVWNVDQITQLFDSLMKEYPISSFLFWQVESNNVDSYQFYEFVRDYHERDGRRNPKANINGERGIRGCGRFFGLDYAARPRLRRYSIGLIASKDILIRSSLYQRRKPSSSYMNSSRETPSQDLV